MFSYFSIQMPYGQSFSGLRALLMLHLLLMLPLLASAQRQISGTVSIEEDRQPLPGAAIYIPELGKGTVTDGSGSYLLDGLPAGTFSIEFSYLGFQTQVVRVDLRQASSLQDVVLKATVIQTQEVVVSSSSYTTQHENAVKIETLGAGQVLASGQPDFIGAITQIAGVDMISRGNSISKPVIRGLSNANVVVLNNGIKLENYQFSEDHPFVMDEFGVGQVEVIKGPASLLYGSDAVGGIINVIPLKPAPIGHIDGQFSTRYFTNTLGVASGLGVRGTGQHFNWGIQGGMKSHADYTDGDGNIIYNSRFSSRSLKLNGGVNRSFGSFQLYYDYTGMEPGMTTPGALELVTDRGRERKFWYQDLDNHILQARKKLFVNRWKIGTNLSWQQNQRRLNTDEMHEVDMRLNTYSYDLKVWLPSSEQTEYILGVQGAFIDNKNGDGHIRVLPDYGQTDLAFVGWMKHTHLNNVSVQAGLRWEYRNLHAPEQEKASHSHEEHGGEGEEEEEEIMEALDRSYQNISFSIGGTWQITPELLWRFNAASAYRTPNMAELTQDGVHGPRYEVGNRDLNSQRSYEGDLSLHYHSGILEFDAAGFYNHVNDYIFLAPTGDYDEDYPIYMYSQSDAHLYGVEAFLSVYPVNWLNAKVVYAYIRGEQDNGDHLPFIPHDKVKLDLKLEQDKAWRLLDPYFTIGVAYAVQQDRPAPFETVTDDYVLLDAGIGFRVRVQQQKLEFNVLANNLLNEVYFDHLSALKPLGLRNIGRNVSFNLVIPFGLLRP